jgi:hypothetical protein
VAGLAKTAAPGETWHIRATRCRPRAVAQEVAQEMVDTGAGGWYTHRVQSDAKSRRANVATRVLRPADRTGVEDFELGYWMQIPSEERFGEAWKLSLEQWTLRNGGRPPEPGLSRSATRVLRR